MAPPETPWFLYVLKCNDGSLYCGITTDLLRRVDQHNAGTGARYTRARRPVGLAGSWTCADRSSALKFEAAFKKLPRSAKLRRLSEPLSALPKAPVKTHPRRRPKAERPPQRESS